MSTKPSASLFLSALMTAALVNPAIAQQPFGLKEGQTLGGFVVTSAVRYDTPGRIFAEYDLHAFLVFDNDTGQARPVGKLPAKRARGETHLKLEARLKVEQDMADKAEIARNWGGNAYQTPAIGQWADDVPEHDEDADFLRPLAFNAGANAYIGQLDNRVYVYGMTRETNIFWSLRVRCQEEPVGQPLTFKKGHAADAYEKAYFGSDNYDPAVALRLNREDIAYFEAQAKKVEREYRPQSTNVSAQRLLYVLLGLRPTATPPELKVVADNEDGVHRPLQYSIYLTHQKKPLADVPIRFDLEGDYKGLSDDFAVWDPDIRNWRGVTRNKIYGVHWDRAPKTDENGRIVLRFYVDLFRLRELKPMPLTVTFKAETPPLGPEKVILSASGTSTAKNLAFARRMYYRHGSITYPEVEPGHRVKRVRRGPWQPQVATTTELWRLYGLVQINHKPFSPVNDSGGHYWHPIPNGSVLTMDADAVAVNSSMGRGELRDPTNAMWGLPPGGGAALEIEWLDGTAGMFMVHRNDKPQAIRVLIGRCAGDPKGKAVGRFIEQQAAEAAGEYAVKKLMLYTLSPPAAQAAEVGWYVFEGAKTMYDMTEALLMAAGSTIRLPGGGTYVRLRSEVACGYGPDGKRRLYVREGSPEVVAPDGTAVTVLAGQAVGFGFGGAEGKPQAAAMPGHLFDALDALSESAVLDEPAWSGLHAIAANPSPPQPHPEGVDISATRGNETRPQDPQHAGNTRSSSNPVATDAPNGPAAIPADTYTTNTPITVPGDAGTPTPPVEIPEDIRTPSGPLEGRATSVLTTIGIDVLPPTREVRQVLGMRGGAAVVGIRENSLASRTSLQRGDMIVVLGDQEVMSPEHLEQLLASQLAAGRRSVSLGLNRPGENMSYRVTVALPYRETTPSVAPPAPPVAPPILTPPPIDARPYVGVNVRDVSDPESLQLGIRAQWGAVLTRVYANSPAGKAGMRDGDVVFGCDGKRVTSRAALADMINASRPGQRHTIDFLRGPETYRVELVLETWPDSR